MAAIIVALGLNWIGCAAAPPEPAAKKVVAPVGMYTMEVKPLETQQCGRCHQYFYNLIKEEGGKHRIDCRRCHVEFHIYRPGRVKYEDILPKCEACHEQVHGPELTHCAECHEAHTPMRLPAARILEQSCHMCHPELDKEMKTYVTQHTELYCFTCHHTRHGYVPECMECHQSHTEEMTEAECLICHPPHKALQVVYPEDIPQESCASCHQRAYDMLKQSSTKHTPLSCAKCHPEHGAIIRCEQCHPQIHSADMLERFPTCGGCHGVAHGLQ